MPFSSAPLSPSPQYSSPFQSFFMGGFECATHRRRDRTRIDVIAGSGHDTHCARDYGLLAEAGITTVRDGLRWHKIEARPGVYDWSSLLPMLQAANATGTQVLWDLCHWGVPDWLDVFSAEFPARFAAFSAAAVAFMAEHRKPATAGALGAVGADLFCPINETSFWSWIGGDLDHFYPYGPGRGPQLKRQLVRAAVAATRELRAFDPRVRLIQPEPIIHISADPQRPEDRAAAAGYTASQFEVWDMLAGRRDAELGGSPDALDVIGVNYYFNNQWIHNGPQTPFGHPQHRPLHLLLADVWERYKRPIVITETGAEEPATCGWLGYVSSEVREALRLGVEVQGICLYPVMDYPGWDDDRHCPCGLIETSADWSSRALRPHVRDELQIQAKALPSR